VDDVNDGPTTAGGREIGLDGDCLVVADGRIEQRPHDNVCPIERRVTDHPSLGGDENATAVARAWIPDLQLATVNYVLNPGCARQRLDLVAYRARKVWVSEFDANALILELKSSFFGQLLHELGDVGLPLDARRRRIRDVRLGARHGFYAKRHLRLRLGVHIRLSDDS